MANGVVVNLTNPEDSPQKIADKLNGLTPALDMSVIKGDIVTRKELSEITGKFNKFIEGKEDRVNYNTSQGRNKLSDQRYHGGGMPFTGANANVDLGAFSLSAGLIKSTRPTAGDHNFESWRTGEAFPRSYTDTYGSFFLGGLGSATAPLKFGKDPLNQQFLNFTNTDGPATIFIADSTTNSGTTNAESTFTGRVITGNGGSEWVDWFHNHYLTNGDMNYGILLQKISPGAYREFLQAFTDNAASDPKGQIKNANWFSVITPTISTGSSGGTTLTGTASKTAGSAIITGSGTAFDTELAINDSIAIGTEYATVLTVDSATQITCAANLLVDGSGLTINKFNRFMGRMGIRTRYPTAFLHIGGAQGGGATVGSAQFKIDAQALLTTPEAGAMEQETNNLFFTLGTTRYSLVMNNKGVSGGQTIVGGTASGNNLALSSTSNATKGNITFGSSAYDEVNNRIGIRTSSPLQSIHTTGSIALGGTTSYILLAGTPTGVRTATFPDSSGTVAYTGLAGTKVYYVSDSSGGAVNRKLTFTNGILTAET